MPKVLPEFSANEDPKWAQQAHLEALEREGQGYANRMAELKALGVKEDDPIYTDAASGAESVKEQLRRLAGGGGQKVAAKRPRAEAKQEQRAAEPKKEKK